MGVLRFRGPRSQERPPAWICEPCRETDHEHCVGRGHCDCQHRTAAPTEPATGPAGE